MDNQHNILNFMRCIILPIEIVEIRFIGFFFFLKLESEFEIYQVKWQKR